MHALQRHSGDGTHVVTGWRNAVGVLGGLVADVRPLSAVGVALRARLGAVRELVGADHAVVELPAKRLALVIARVVLWLAARLKLLLVSLLLMACESERQHEVILVRNTGLSQLDEYHLW